MEKKRCRAWMGRVVFLIFAAGLLFGCATAPKKSTLSLLWPEPPETPRIKYVRTLASEADLGVKRTFWDAVMKFLTGRTPAIWRMAEPVDVAVSDDGKRVYVSDYGQGVVYAYDLEKKTVHRIGADKPFARPFGLALDADDHLYVVNQETRSITVLDVKEGVNGEEASEERVVRVITDPGLERPTDIAIDRQRGLIYVVDASRKISENHFVKVFNMEGRFLRNIGKGKGVDEGSFYFPTYVALDDSGNLYVTDTMNARVSVFDPDGNYIKTIGSRGDGFGLFDKPKGVALDSFGNIYVVDSGWSNVQIFNPKGEVLLFFGGRSGYPGMMKNPTGIAISRQNTIYVADLLNYRVDVYQLVNTTASDSLKPNPDQTEKGGESKDTPQTAQKP